MAPTQKPESFLYDGRPEVKGGPRTTTHALIVGETPRKWIIAGPGLYGGEWSVPKSGGDRREGRNTRGWTQEFFLTQEALEAWRTEQEDLRWAGEHHWRIAQRVSASRDAAVLRQIAALIGYNPSEVA